MKRLNQALWGIILVCVGLVLCLNALGITRIDVFFDGWWTLFIIVPSFVGVLTGKDKTGSLIGLCIGVFLLLCCWNILDFGILWKLLLPVIILLFGAKMIFESFFTKDGAEAMKHFHNSDGEIRYGTAVFSGENINFAGQIFQGAELNAVFGGVKCDLRNAVIQEDCVIQASAIFGGIDIFVPDNVNIKVSSSSIFGGTSNKKGNPNMDGAPTIYVKTTCMFGGVDIK